MFYKKNIEIDHPFYNEYWMPINTIFPVSVQVWPPGQTRKVGMFYKMAKKVKV